MTSPIGELAELGMTDSEFRDFMGIEADARIEPYVIDAANEKVRALSVASRSIVARQARQVASGF